MNEGRRQSAIATKAVGEYMQKVRAEEEKAERRKRECQASFWCRNAKAVGTIAGIATGVIVGAVCMAVTAGAGSVGCAALGGFVGGAVGSLVGNALDGEDESFGQLVGEALLAGAVGAVAGAAAAVVGAAAFGAGVAMSAGMGLKAASQMAVGSARSAVSASGSAAGSGLRGCATNSFAPGTHVVLADGTTKPIEKLEPDDKVLATDPETGETVAKPVTATIIGDGVKNLVRVKIDTDSGDASGELIATDKHPFWVRDLGEWVDATELKAGQWLRTAAGTYVQITAIERWTQTQRVHNLTVADIHTYYVLAGSTPLLVHNCGGKELGHSRLCKCADGEEPTLLPDFRSLPARPDPDDLVPRTRTPNRPVDQSEWATRPDNPDIPATRWGKFKYAAGKFLEIWFG